jgi:Helicase associated domain
MTSATTPAMRIEQMTCNHPFTITFETTDNPSHAVLPQSGTPEDPLVASFKENHDDRLGASSLMFGHHSMNPTPINHEQMTIVKKIKLGSLWYPRDTIDLLKQLLVPGPIDLQDTEPPIRNSYSVSLVSDSDHPTSRAQGGGGPPREEDDEASHGGKKAEDKWNERFHSLVKYREEHGHCLVPHHWVGDRQLAQWVKRQRYQFKLKGEGKHSTLSDERMEILNTIGFVWSRHTARWEERYRELVDFARRYGHCNVPSSHPDIPQLSVWVRCQRRQYRLAQSKRKSYMTRERMVRLNRLGFVFEPRTTHDRNTKGHGV